MKSLLIVLLALASTIYPIQIIISNCQIRAVSAKTPASSSDVMSTQSRLAEWLISTSDSSRYKQLAVPGVLDHEEVPIGNKPVSSSAELIGSPDFEPASCQLAKVVLVLQRPGCQAKAISSYACTGACPSYVQVSLTSLNDIIQIQVRYITC